MVSVTESKQAGGTHHEKRGLGQQLSKILWVIFASFSVFYAIVAFEYFFSFGTENEGLWLTILSWVVSAEYASGLGSVHSDQLVPYTNGYTFLLPHTIFGAICLAIGPFQFVGKIRNKYTALHRNMGKVYLIAVAISMCFGLAYLFTTPMEQVFSGKPFSVGLIGLDIIVLISAWFAYSSIKAGKVVRHQAWMAFNLSLIFATPFLRFLWVFFGNTLPEFNQAQANVGIMTFLLPLCLLGGMIWYSLLHCKITPKPIGEVS